MTAAPAGDQGGGGDQGEGRRRDGRREQSTKGHRPGAARPQAWPPGYPGDARNSATLGEHQTSSKLPSGSGVSTPKALTSANRPNPGAVGYACQCAQPTERGHRDQVPGRTLGSWAV